MKPYTRYLSGRVVSAGFAFTHETAYEISGREVAFLMRTYIGYFFISSLSSSVLGDISFVSLTDGSAGVAKGLQFIISTESIRAIIFSC
jgi:hypothetical protein